VDAEDMYNINALISNGQLLIAPVGHIGKGDLEIEEDKECVGYVSIKNLRELS
tara:strand:+ start:1689 stop:1847 length:159 start_codon:yes stop_codon:yes gene_type:complete